jgi:hypothetical protein
MQTIVYQCDTAMPAQKLPNCCNMKKILYLLPLVLLALVVASCTLKKQVSVKEYYPPTTEQIPIIQTNQPLPQNIYRIGSIVVGENGLTPDGKCTYEACMQVIEKESRKVGAQLVYLVKVKEPDILSTCYNITAELYRYSE